MADADVVIDVGNPFLASLYKLANNEATSLSKLSYLCYLRFAYNTSIHLASLPHTEPVINQHSLRAYFRVEEWLGNKNEHEEWSWKKTKDGPELTMPLQPAPRTFSRCKCQNT